MGSSLKKGIVRFGAYKFTFKLGIACLQAIHFRIVFMSVMRKTFVIVKNKGKLHEVTYDCFLGAITCS